MATYCSAGGEVTQRGVVTAASGRGPDQVGNVGSRGAGVGDGHRRSLAQGLRSAVMASEPAQDVASSPYGDALAAGRASAAAAEVEAALAVPPDPHAAAFFDVDNTVMQGASIFHLARGPLRAATSSPPATSAASPGSRPSSGCSAARTWSTSTRRARPHCPSSRGTPSPSCAAIGEEIFDEVMADKIWPGTRALAQMHLDAGQRVWLVTATPVEVADGDRRAGSG